MVFLSQARIESQDSKAYALDFAKNYSALGNDPKMIAEYVNFASQQVPPYTLYKKYITGAAIR